MGRICILGLILTLVSFSLVYSDAIALKPGDKAPEFELEGSDGKTYRLSDLKGTVVVLAWFPKAFTGGCTLECKSFRENGAELKKFDVAYFAASCDTPETNKRFSESLMLDYPVLSDPEYIAATQYGVATDKSRFPSRWTFYIGTDGKILYIDKEVNVATHGKDVANKLKELGVKLK